MAAASQALASAEAPAPSRLADAPGPRSAVAARRDWPVAADEPGRATGPAPDRREVVAHHGELAPARAHRGRAAPGTRGRGWRVRRRRGRCWPAWRQPRAGGCTLGPPRWLRV